MTPLPESTTTGETIAALIGIPILILFLLLAGGLAFVAYRFKRWERQGGQGDPDALISPAGALCIAIALWIGAVSAAAGLWWGMYPWKWEYHEWRPIAGTVATVDSRLAPTGDKSMEDKFVVTFEGNPQQYGVLDTRAATLRPGDDLVITCVRRWQWSGSHGFDCNFVSMARSAR